MAISPLVVDADVIEIDGIYYQLKSNTAIVTSGTKKYSGQIKIPGAISYEGKSYSVIAISDLAFYACSDLTAVEIPDGVTSIGYETFMNCSNLVSAVLPNSITSMDKCAFMSCYKLKSINIPTGITTIEGSVFRNCMALTTVNLPEGITSIGNDAFHSCTKLTSIIIPNTVETIGESAFDECRDLNSVKMSTALKGLGKDAFRNCSSLTSIEFPNTLTYFFGYNPGGMFYGCSKLESVILSDNIKTIPNGMFYGCSSLSSISIPDKIEKIEGMAFYNSGLKSIVLPNGVTEIGDHAFKGCKYLKTVTLGRNMSSIGPCAFSGCNELSDFYCHAGKIINIDELSSNKDDWSWYVFYGSYIEYATLHVPESLVSSYQETVPWCYFGTIVGIPEEDTGIAVNSNNESTIIGRYSINGQHLSSNSKGIIIIKMSDGSAKKVLLK